MNLPAIEDSEAMYNMYTGTLYICILIIHIRRGTLLKYGRYTIPYYGMVLVDE